MTNYKTQTPFTFRKSAMAAALAMASLPLIAQELVLEEVVVTAQKRAESVQDIAATVNVVSGDSVDKFAAFNFDDIEQQTAGVGLTRNNARSATISMRGVSVDPESGMAATVDVYWNGMVVRPDIAFTQLYDLERMEVLRGPQGSLQGRTSPAGAINILTRKPDLYESDGYVQLVVADNDGLNTQAGWGGPLVEGKFGMRISGVYDENNAANISNITTGLESEAEAKSARLSALWQVTDNFSADMAWQYLDREIDDPRAVSGIDSLGERPTLGDTDQTALSSFDSYSELDYDVASLTLDWELAGHRITAVTGYNRSDKYSPRAIDLANYSTNPDAPTYATSTTSVDSIAQEVRLASVENERWDYIVGLYFQDQETSTDFENNRTISLAPGQDFTIQTVGTLPVDLKDWAVFSFNTFYLTDRAQLEVGLRYTEYERSRSADVLFGGFPYFSEDIPPSLADAIINGVAGQFPIVGIDEENQKTTEDAVTGTLALRYDWGDNTSLYASYNRGYRPSGISIIPSPAVELLPGGQDYISHDEETSDSVEFGFKTRLWDGRASLNGALYFVKYDGYLGFVRGVQVLDDAGQPTDITGGIIYNGDANVWGVELDGQVLLTETWNLGGAVSYNHSEWDGAEQPCNDREPGEVVGSCDVDGERIGGEPEWSLSLNSEYFIPLDSTELYIRGLYKYTGERDNIDASAGIGDVRAEFDDYHLFSLFAGWRSSEYSWDFSVWAKNLLDEDQVTFQTGSDQYDIAASGGSYTNINILQERTLGVTARYNF